MRGDDGLTLRTLSRLDQVPAPQWDRVFASTNPFIRHDFLSALENHRCVDRETGWEPCHRIVVDTDGTPVAAMPLYRKYHSYGEFVFDFSWAQASHRLGRPYYPKLLCAVPFSPVSGPRLGATSEAARRLLLDSLVADLEDSGPSSAHILFPEQPESPPGGWLERNDVQFHWFNRGYESFDQFLGTLTHSRRQKIRRERRRCAESGLRFENRRGGELTEREWAAVWSMYANTYDERGQAPYLSLDFFLDYGRRHDTPLRLILAYNASTPVAVAITFVSDRVLYGRHWGCAENHHSLHFETCYYQGIELCLREGYMHFDAGTQGEHKHARGFDPVLTRSFHRLSDPRLHDAVDRFIREEREAVGGYRQALLERGPYRKADARVA